MPKPDIPAEEAAFQQRYVQAPSFLSMHVGVKADVLPPGTECHHLILEVSWKFLGALAVGSHGWRHLYPALR